MRRKTTALFTELGKEEINALTATVNEVVATGFKISSNVFTSADLWNIQRQKRSFVQRRNRF